MARAGFVFRFLKPCAVAAFLAVVAACGGDGATALPEVVRVTLTGMPDLPLAPMQTAQLTAIAAYSDGAMSDVTDTATWDTTDPGMLTVSATGLVTATGPGKADVTATFGGVSGSVSAQVVALPAAYFVNGVEYAFDYQLDAQGRVSSYRISKRPELAYEPGDYDLITCSGDLYGSYGCGSRAAGMSGEGGKVTRITWFQYVGSASATFSYGPYGLSGMAAEWHTGLSSHEGGSSTTTLTYDAPGRLKEVKQDCGYGDLGSYWRVIATAQITVDSQGRLTHAEHTVERQQFRAEPHYDCSIGSPPNLFPEALNGTIDWTYDGIGFMTTAGPTTYSVDSAGYLVSRRLNGVVDTYAIIRSGQRIAEEQFTQAEPRAFYRSRAPQRVRYEWGRLPTEPLFVPRALTGLNGADYFGIISSHHR